MGKEHSPIMNH